MAITLISNTAPSSPLQALGGTGLTGAEGGSAGFDALFSQLLGGEGSTEEIPLDLFATGAEASLAEALPIGTQGIPTGLQEAIKGLLGESQSQPNEDKKTGEESGAEDSGFVLLGAFQIPTQAAQTSLEPGQDLLGERAGGRTAGLLQEQAGLLERQGGQESANLAAGQEDFAQVLHGNAAHGAHAARDAATETGIRTPVQNPAWGQEFGEKIVWMAKSDQQQAQLTLNPPNLGPLQISLSLDGNQATAVFTSAHQEVRQAIQDALPQLREMLAGAGVSLGQTNVGAEAQRDQQMARQQQSPSQSRGDNAILEPDSGTTLPVVQRGGRGMVDLFA